MRYSYEDKETQCELIVRKEENSTTVCLTDMVENFPLGTIELNEVESQKFKDFIMKRPDYNNKDKEKEKDYHNQFNLVKNLATVEGQAWSLSTREREALQSVLLDLELVQIEKNRYKKALKNICFEALLHKNPLAGSHLSQGLDLAEQIAQKALEPNNHP